MFDQEHHDKWIKIAKDNGRVITDIEIFGLDSLEQLAKLYSEDENLNNIPLRFFDNLYRLAPVKGGALYYGACIYKALLIQLLIDNGLMPKICEICYREFPEKEMVKNASGEPTKYCRTCNGIIGKGAGYANNVSDEEAEQWLQGSKDRKAKLIKDKKL